MFQSILIKHIITQILIKFNFSFTLSINFILELFVKNIFSKPLYTEQMFGYNVYEVQTMRIIFHIDVNSAFLSWSAVERIKKGIYPDLRTIPSVVGGSKKDRKGIVLASSIPAKKHGIKTGEQLFKAFEKCSNLVVVPPDFSVYAESSKKMREICNRFSPYVEMFSVDELFLDYTNMDMHFGPPETGAEKIKKAIFDETGVTVNIGISTNKLLAKMASDFEKPNKIHTLYPEEIQEKMWPLPVSNLLMIGRQTSKKLDILGIKTIGQLANADLKTLTYHFKSQGKVMKAYANGQDFSVVNSIPDEVQSISNGTTIEKDVFTPDEANPILLSLCEKVSFRMRNKNFSCGLITLTVKTKDFKISNHSEQLPHPVFTAFELYNCVKKIMLKNWSGTPIRALTIAVSKFTDIDYYQYNFFDNTINQRKEILAKKIDSIRKIYGYTAVTPASLLKHPTATKLASENAPKLSSRL